MPMCFLPCTASPCTTAGSACLTILQPPMLSWTRTSSGVDRLRCESLGRREGSAAPVSGAAPCAGAAPSAARDAGGDSPVGLDWFRGSLGLGYLGTIAAVGSEGLNAWRRVDADPSDSSRAWAAPRRQGEAGRCTNTCALKTRFSGPSWNGGCERTPPRRMCSRPWGRVAPMISGAVGTTCFWHWGSRVDGREG
jgi:hypothetical protein